MSLGDKCGPEISISLETATDLGRANHGWDKVYEYIFVHPTDFFVILPNRKWSIAHQTVYHGNLDHLKRILGLFTDDQVNIRFQGKDGKTLLDVATERKDNHQANHQAVYTYVERLFAQDELIEEGKKGNWRSVIDLLEKNRHLANEKPPYSPCFLLHYVVQHGDTHILNDLLGNFPFLTNVLSVDKETPLDIAMRLNKSEMRSILEPRTQPRSNLFPVPSHSSPPISSHSSTSVPPQSISRPNEPLKNQSPIVPTPPRTPLGFGNIVNDINQNGTASVGAPNLFNSDRARQLQPQQQQKQQQKTPTRVQHIHCRKTIISEVPLNDRDPSPQPASVSQNEQLMRNLKCYLTQQVFDDPVIASDGQTYERAAILDWVRVYRCSPITGAPMDATFRDNTEIKQIIQSMRR